MIPPTLLVSPLHWDTSSNTEWSGGISWDVGQAECLCLGHRHLDEEGETTYLTLI